MSIIDSPVALVQVISPLSLVEQSMVLDPLGIHMQKINQSINLETNLIPHKINSRETHGYKSEIQNYKFPRR